MSSSETGLPPSTETALGSDEPRDDEGQQPGPETLKTKTIPQAKSSGDISALFHKYVFVWIFSIFVGVAASASLAFMSILRNAHGNFGTLAVVLSGAFLAMVFARLWRSLRTLFAEDVLPRLVESESSLFKGFDKTFAALETAVMGIIVLSILNAALGIFL